jgi:hypothetical protein
MLQLYEGMSMSLGQVTLHPEDSVLAYHNQQWWPLQPQLHL